jgi:uncharacterized protein (DUF2249 family)
MQAAREALEQKNAGDFYVVELKVGRVWKVEQKLVEVKAKPESAEEKK